MVNMPIKTLMEKSELTARDFFALAALTGITVVSEGEAYDPKMAAILAYEHADAMLLARESESKSE